LTWKDISIGAGISDSATVYLVKGQTYVFQAVLAVWTAAAAPATFTVGCLIMLSGPGLVKLSIT